MPANPFTDKGTSVKHLYLVKKTDTELVLKELNEQMGFIYSESFVVYTQWDAYTPDVRSN